MFDIKLFSQLVILLLVSIAYPSYSAILLVPSQHSTIQDAINFAIDGDVIQVGSGTYFENINYSGKAITVESENGAMLTAIDGSGSDSVVRFSSGESNASILRGFTIINGSASEGAGIFVSSSSPIIENNIIIENGGCSGSGIALAFASPIIRNNEISDNILAGCSGGLGGGGISIRGASSSVIDNNTISNNQSNGGAAISFFAAGNPTVKNNLISHNRSTGRGGAFSLVNRSDAIIEQNLIFGNSASEGGAIYWLVPSGGEGPQLTNNTFAENSASGLGSVIFADGFDGRANLTNNLIIGISGEAAIYCGSFNDTNSPQFSSNNVYSESADAYSGLCTDQTGVNGNISAPALFADTSVEDFRLAVDSTSLDAGTVQQQITEDFLGNLRTTDGNGDGNAIIDLGAYEMHFPIITLAADFIVESGTTGVELDGTDASDVDGVISSYLWEQTDGLVVALSDSSNVSPTFSAPSSSTELIFKLTVTDDLGFQGSDTIKITVNSLPTVPTSSGGGGSLFYTTILFFAMILIRRGYKSIIVIDY